MKKIARICFLSILPLACGTLLGQTEPAETATADQLAARIEQLIRQLGDEEFKTREAASQELAKLGGRAREALEQATKSTDAEIASRAKAILAALPKLTHTIVDAIGQPIPLAEVTITLANSSPLTAAPLPKGALPPAPQPDEDAARTVATLSEENGRIGIPETGPETGAVVTVTVRHPDYGQARIAVRSTAGNSNIQVPLVRSGTEAYKRAIRGELVAPDGKPVASAVIRCSDVRTPGEGLIEGTDPRGEVISDEEGRFTYYLPPSDVRRSERGELIPVNSRFGLTFSVPANDAFVPWAGRYSNLEPVRIELPRATRTHRFRFEATSGGILSDEQQLKNLRVQLDRIENGERLLIDQGPDIATTSRKLLPGKYVAEAFLNGKTIAYLPLVITDDSPEELTFLLPHAITYRGRVVEGVTGEPVAGALVVGWSSTAYNNLAVLTGDDWKLLRETPSNPPLDHPAIALLRKHYGVQGLVRADGDGRFEIVRQPDQEFYGIMAFAEETIPYKVSVGSLKPNEKHAIDTGEFPLFPAARIVVRPVFGGDRLSVSPLWLPAEKDQPQWFSRFQAAGKSYEREFAYVHWLKLNEPQPVFVPAGIRLNVRFESPYNDQWAPALVENVLLEARATKEIGDLEFAANLPVTVRVVDSAGKPIEGIPVRQMQAGTNSWTVAHNTDAEGLARFFAQRNSQGRFWVSDLPGTQEERTAENLFGNFQVADSAPAQPFQITITAAQMKLLLGSKKAP